MKCAYLVLTPFFPSNENFRGAYIYDQVKAIQENTDYLPVVVLLTTFFSKEREAYNYQGIKCLPFQVWDLPSFLFPGLFHKINAWRLNRFLFRNNVSLSSSTTIHSHVAYPAAYFASSLGKRYGSKTLAQHHGLVSQKVLDELQNEISFSNKMLVLHNGVDSEKFYFDSAINKTAVFTIGCIGNFWKIKDQISLLKSCRILKEKGIIDIEIKFIGSGETLFDCQEFAREHQLNCEFKTEVDHTQLNAFYNQLDLFVLPSYYEAFGCVYTEAWAAGVPFIAVEGQGIEEVMTEEMRFKQLVSKESPEQLADKIQYFYQNKERLAFNPELDIQQTIKTFFSKIEG
jgi:glycosyltransferase involved in cell wall biosynthesis